MADYPTITRTFELREDEYLLEVSRGRYRALDDRYGVFLSSVPHKVVRRQLRLIPCVDAPGGYYACWLYTIRMSESALRCLYRLVDEDSIPF